MSPAIAIEIAGGAIVAIIAVYTFIFAARANRAQAAASKTAVDASAYTRAQAIYESAIEQLQAQTRDLGYQVGALQAEVTRLRSQAAELSAEVMRLRTTNEELRNEVHALRAAARKDPP